MDNANCISIFKVFTSLNFHLQKYCTLASLSTFYIQVDIGIKNWFPCGRCVTLNKAHPEHILCLLGTHLLPVEIMYFTT